MNKLKEYKEPKDIFIDGLKELITNLLIENINYRNGHYEREKII